MKKLIYISLILLYGLPVFGCLNMYNTRLNGKKTMNDNLVMYFNIWERSVINNVESWLNDEAKALEEKNQKGWELHDLSDYSAILIKLNRLPEAKRILDTLILSHSQEYSINANYGTLWELMGDNKKALFYIKKSVTINPESHEGSEWLHVKILEAKIKMANKKDWLKLNPLVKNDFGNDSIPDTVAIKHIPNARKLINSILYQLNERTFFVRPKDEIVCSLFYSAACIFQYVYGNEYARDLYFLSLEYGDIHKDNCIKRIAYIEDHYKINPHEHLKRTLAIYKDSTTEIIVEDSLKNNVSQIKKSQVKKEPEKKNQTRKPFFLIFLSPLFILFIAIAAKKRRNRKKSENSK